jgi:hypothetical protein
MARENDKFHSDIDEIFESYLKTEARPVIRITKGGKVITKMNYDKVMFDSELNIYKRMPDGTLSMINDPDFKAVVISQ